MTTHLFQPSHTHFLASCASMSCHRLCATPKHSAGVCKASSRIGNVSVQALSVSHQSPSRPPLVMIPMHRTGNTTSHGSSSEATVQTTASTSTTGSAKAEGPHTNQATSTHTANIHKGHTLAMVATRTHLLHYSIPNTSVSHHDTSYRQAFTTAPL